MHHRIPNPFRPTLLMLSVLAGVTAGAQQGVQTRTLQDETGRTVTLPDHPRRIISLVPSVTDDVFALGAASTVVAVSDFTKFPVAATSKPSVGSILHPSIESIVALHPDLILAMPVANDAPTLAQFDRLGIPVFLVDTHGLNGILTSITDLGRALHREPEAAALDASLAARIAAVRTRALGKPALPVFLPIAFEPVITVGKGAFITDLIAAAGARSVTADLPEEWPHISMEAVVARQPQVLLLIHDSFTDVESIRNRPGWKDLPALRHNRVLLLDERVYLPSPAAIDALEDMARQFHP